MASKFCYLQLNKLTLGALRITEPFDKVKVMTLGKLNRILKNLINGNILKYLKEKMGEKGRDVTYSKIEMV